MKKILIVAVAIASCLTASPSFARQKYWLTIGCWPDYRMHHIACDVGTPKRDCARIACYGHVMTTNPGNADRLNAAKHVDEKEPKIFSTSPTEPK